MGGRVSLCLSVELARDLTGLTGHQGDNSGKLLILAVVGQRTYTREANSGMRRARSGALTNELMPQRGW